MAETQVRVTFQPQGRAVFVLPGTKILEAAGRAGLTIDTPCGGAGTCGKCRVRLTAGAPEPTDADRRALGQTELDDGWRLACQTAIQSEIAVSVPENSLFASQHQILETWKTEAAGEIEPAVRKVYVEMPPPTLEDNAADLMRLEQKVGPFKTDLALLRQLPGKLRQHDFVGTAVLSDHRLIDFEPGDTTAKCYGAAFDVGTTTIIGVLLDLCSGEELAVTSSINPQVSFGDDVLSRIKYAGAQPDGLDELHKTVVGEVVRMIGEMCAEAKVSCEHIYEVAFAGNTTMEQLLCGIDPAQLGHVPFVPVHARGLLLPARELNIPINHCGMAYVFPVVGGFVGGDTVAGMLATQLSSQASPALMVDIGTNGEIVLADDGEIRAASTAAGPAFEGARISCGMRAAHGAIEKVVLDDDVRCSVIGNCPPVGLCGSGLIDLVAELLKCGIVSPAGRLLPPDELPPALPPALKQRVRLGPDGQGEFLLAEGEGDSALTLSQRDVRELQLASGAIRAGIVILLKNAGLKTTDLKSVLLAGGFGSFIRRSNAQRIGLLPADIDHSRIHYVGNVSLSGARWALLSCEARRWAEQLARRTSHVQLSGDADFQNEFAEAMIFPDSPKC